MDRITIFFASGYEGSIINAKKNPIILKKLDMVYDKDQKIFVSRDVADAKKRYLEEEK